MGKKIERISRIDARIFCACLCGGGWENLRDRCAHCLRLSVWGRLRESQGSMCALFVHDCVTFSFCCWFTSGLFLRHEMGKVAAPQLAPPTPQKGGIWHVLFCDHVLVGNVIVFPLVDGGCEGCLLS